MSHVELDGTTKSFGRTTALDAMTLAFGEGELTALLGPSGCGKSTLLRLIAGLEAPTAGRIVIDGSDVSDTAPERRGVGMMFQSYALFPHMTVAHNLAFPLRMSGRFDRRERARRVAQALDLVRLPDIGARRISSLSGGQQQRVALARAFIAEPRVMLLDEPLSNLDARLRAEMQIEIREIQSRLGLTTIFVTHDQEEALSIADTVVLMRDGRMEQRGTPEELYARPASSFAADFIGAANIIPAEARRDGDDWRAFLEDVPGSAVPLAPGQVNSPGSIRLVLRQEDIRVAEAEAAGHHGVSIDGRVAARAFLGARTRLVVTVGERRLTVLAGRETQLRPGSDCVVSWDPAVPRILTPS